MNQSAFLSEVERRMEIWGAWDQDMMSVYEPDLFRATMDIAQLLRIVKRLREAGENTWHSGRGCTRNHDETWTYTMAYESFDQLRSALDDNGEE